MIAIRGENTKFESCSYLTRHFMKSLITIALSLMFTGIYAQKQVLVPHVDFWDKAGKMKKSQGQYLDGFEHGFWKYWHETGQLMEESNYFRGKLHGEVKRYYENGALRHVGYFKLNQQDSLMQSWYKNGKLMETGFYLDGVKQKAWYYFYESGDSMLTEQYQNDTLLVMSWWDNKGIKTVTKGNGEKRLYYNSGELKELYRYQNGIPHGNFEEYFAGGKMRSSGSYNHGLRQGPWKYYFS